MATPETRIARLEAELELARASLESHVHALDRRIAELKAQRDDLQRRNTELVEERRKLAAELERWRNEACP